MSIDNKLYIFTKSGCRPGAAPLRIGSRSAVDPLSGTTPSSDTAKLFNEKNDLIDTMTY